MSKAMYISPEDSYVSATMGFTINITGTAGHYYYDANGNTVDSTLFITCNEIEVNSQPFKVQANTGYGVQIVYFDNNHNFISRETENLIQLDGEQVLYQNDVKASYIRITGGMVSGTITETIFSNNIFAYIPLPGIARKVKKMYISPEDSYVDATMGFTINITGTAGHYYYDANGNAVDSTLFITCNEIEVNSQPFKVKANETCGVQIVYFNDNSEFIERETSTPIILDNGEKAYPNNIGAKYIRITGGLVSGEAMTETIFADNIFAYLYKPNVAHAVKKAYLGVNGIARLIYEKIFGDISFYKEISNFFPDDFTHGYASASTGKLAVFAGGTDYTNYTNRVFALDNSLSLISNVEPYTTQAKNITGLSYYDKYAIFAGGSTFGSSTGAAYPNKYIVAYDDNMTKTICTDLKSAKKDMSAETVGGYGIFIGGDSDTNLESLYLREVDIYNSALTRIDGYSINLSKANATHTKIGDKYALFACGEYYSQSATSYQYRNNVDIFDKDLTYSQISSLMADRGAIGVAGASVGDYALFAGGNKYGNYTSEIQIINDDLTKISPLNLENASYTCGYSAGNYAAFVGGTVGTTQLNIIEKFDENLIKTIEHFTTAQNFNTLTKADDILIGYASAGKPTVIFNLK